MINLTVQPSMNLQDCLDEINSYGGGTLNLNPTDIFHLNSDLNLPSNISISGNGATFDFGNQAYGIKINNQNVYNTGTITSITSGVNVIGSGTSWLLNVIPYTSQLFFNGQWMRIGPVLTDTTLTLLEGYDGPGFAPGTSYQISIPFNTIALSQLTIQNSTTTGLYINNARFLNLDTIIIQNCNKGLDGNYITELNINSFQPLLNTLDGVTMTNGGRFNWSSLNSVANGGSGIILDSIRSGGFTNGTANSNTLNGFTLTNCSDISILSSDASSNRAKGIECVSNNKSLAFIDLGIRGNASHGICLSASTNLTKITGSDLEFNGGWGIYIGNSNCNNTILVSDSTVSNASGGLSDIGTGTLKSSTVNNFL